METKEAKIDPASKSGDGELLFSQGWGRLFDDLFNGIESIGLRESLATNGPELREHFFFGGIDGGNRAFFSFGHFD